MAIKRYAGDRFVGLSTDTKPTNVPDGATFWESDTLRLYIKYNNEWLPIPIFSDFQTFVRSDGSDGDVTITSDTTLTRDMFYNNLTIQTGVTLKPNGFRIFVKDTLYLYGTIDFSGKNGGNGGTNAAGIGGAGVPAGTVPGSIAGANGGRGGLGGSYSPDPGNNGINASKSLQNTNGRNGGNGGGGSGGAGASGGTGGTATLASGVDWRWEKNYLIPYLLLDNSFQVTAGGAGGGGGGVGSIGYNAGGGGGGGASGGCIFIVAKRIVGNGSIRARGGDGGNGGNGGGGNTGGGGGGAGGNGGVIIAIYNELDSQIVFDVAGGQGGAGGTGYSNGQPGQNGLDGKVIKIKV